MDRRTDDPELLVAMLDHLPAIVLLLDDQVRIRWVNQYASELFGFTVDEAIGRSVMDYLDPDWNPAAFESILTALGASGRRMPMVFRLFREDGSKVIMEVTADVQLDHPVLGGLVVVARRHDERQLLDEALEAMASSRPLEETLALLVQVAESETLDARAALLHDRVGDRFEGVVSSAGLDPVLVGPVPGVDGDVGEAWESLVSSDGGVVHAVRDLAPALRAPAQAAGFRTLWIWPSEPHGGGPASVCAIAWRREDHLDEDQTRRLALERLARVAGLVVDRVRDEQRTAHDAVHDPLTGLANRRGFFAELTDALAEPHEPVGVVYLDLDGFKPVNDRLGHGAGDLVLAEVGRRLQSVAPEHVQAARLGGDEFALVVRATTEEELVALGRAAIACLEQPLVLDASEGIGISASVGVALSAPGTTADELVDAADRALYATKRSGGGAVGSAVSRRRP